MLLPSIDLEHFIVKYKNKTTILNLFFLGEHS